MGRDRARKGGAGSGGDAGGGSERGHEEGGKHEPGRRRAGERGPGRGAAPAALSVCLLLGCWARGAGGDRAAQALFFDGAQFPFNTTSPPNPGVVYITARKTPPTAAVAPWFEFPGSFTVQLWLRPIRVFVGTDVEGGLVGCLVRQTLQGGGGIQAGYGLTITSDANLHWIATVGAETGQVQHAVEVNAWTFVTCVFDGSVPSLRLYYSLGTGDLTKVAGNYKFNQIAPAQINFNTPNDLLLGKLQPLYDSDYYYSGYIEELRFWSSALTQALIDQSVYRVYPPTASQLISQGIVGYWTMNTLVCTEALCNNVAGLQQWIHAASGASAGRFTSSLVMRASPFDTSPSLAGLDCRSQTNSITYPACICSDSAQVYCWDPVNRQPTYCSACPGCNRIQCYGPYGAPKCLNVQGGIVTVNGAVRGANIELNACIDGATSQKWTRFTGIGQLQLADYPLMCLASQTVTPYRGSTLVLEACEFTNRPARQMWAMDPTAMNIVSQLSGLCISSEGSTNGGLPYLKDCINLNPPGSTQPLAGFIFDFAAGHHGALIGGTYTSSASTCTSVSQCDPLVKAPLDQPPIITQVDGVALTDYAILRNSVVNEPLTITLTAYDPNQNDGVRFGFFPYDRNLASDPSVTWPPEYICVGGASNGGNCTCTDQGVCTVCGGGGMCSRNPANPCPSNPCTRTFAWLPTLYTLFSNPTTFVFIASDVPVNEYNASSLAASQQDTPLQAIISVNMPPEFIDPTPPYECVGGTNDGATYPAKADCVARCEVDGGGTCKNPNLYVSIGNSLEFTVKASNRQPGSVIQIIFLGEGPGGLAPPESRLQISDTLPTITLVTDGAVLREVELYNPVTRVWKFTPNSIDAKRTYQQCFLANNPNLPFIPSTQTEVKCVNIIVQTTDPIFDQASPANGSTVPATVGCPLLFTMTALKNDTALYDLQVALHSTSFVAFSGALIPVPGLPTGAVFNNQDATDVSLVFAFQWTPEAGQEGVWQFCFETSDSFEISSELRCVFVDVARCVRCIRPGETLESVGMIYNSHWLELYTVNPYLHADPALLEPGALLNVGVMYRTPKLVALSDLAQYLHVTTSAIRRLNPDIQSDDETLDAFTRVCVMPAVCGNTCGNAAYCDRVPIVGGLL